MDEEKNFEPMEVEHSRFELTPPPGQPNPLTPTVEDTSPTPGCGPGVVGPTTFESYSGAVPRSSGTASSSCGTESFVPPWEHEVPVIAQTGHVRDLPQPLLVEMSKVQRLRPDAKDDSDLVVYLPDGITVRWGRGHDMFYSQVVRNEDKAAVQQMFWFLKRHCVTAVEWQRLNLADSIPPRTAQSGRTGKHNITYEEFVSQQLDMFVMEGSLCAAMQMDIDQCCSDKLLESLLVQWWRTYFPGHACRSNTHKYMCMVCKFIVYTWVQHDLPFWAMQDKDVQLARRLGMDD